MATSPPPESPVEQRRPPQPAAEAAAPKVPPPAPVSKELAVVPTHKVGRHLVYDQYPEAYDVLMSRHDCTSVETALRAIAAELANGHRGSDAAHLGLRVADLGCGTGRLARMVLPVTSNLFATDAAVAMLRRFRERLFNDVPDAHVVGPSPPVPGNSKPYRLHVTLGPSTFEAFLDPWMNSAAPGAVRCPCGECQKTGNAAPPFAEPVAANYRLTTSDAGPFDLVMCGWSLSFVMTAQWGYARWHESVYRAVSAMVASVDPATGGVVCIVETLGNFSDTPVRKNSLHAYLSDVCGFEQTWCRTDYKFRDGAEAARLITFFFGAKVAEKVAASEDPALLKECTGIWVKRVPAAAERASAASAARLE
jgi:SAM-dependent methyltransferase